MYIPRAITDSLVRLAAQYPVITVTGPRQSGKTTLCRNVFPAKDYVSLENPDHRRFAESDPLGFFSQYPDGAIIDEAQRVPDLFSYVQGIVDEHQIPGEFILTGSMQFLLMEKITQSLAGRTALIKLLPFSFSELYDGAETPVDVDEMMFRGFFPRIHDRHLDPTEAYAFYTETYIERDVQSLVKIGNRSSFETFIRLCAGRTGQILNLSTLATDSGISVNTVKSWLSVLETSLLLFKLPPHFANFRKRLVKSPKIYFTDTGLACYLLGIRDHRQLRTHPLRGALFETFVVGELLKHTFNRARVANLYFFRDNSGHEVDVLIDHGQSVTPLEIKATATIRPDLFKGLRYYTDLNPSATKGILAYAGNGNQRRSHVDVLDYSSLASLDLGR